MFEIVITEKRVVDGEKGNEWTSLGKLADGSEPRGYTPVIQCKVPQTIERLRQTVDTLDLTAVIKAVNGL